MALTKDQLLAEVASKLAGNPKITAEKLREVLTDMLDATITGVNENDLKGFKVESDLSGKFAVGINGDSVSLVKLNNSDEALMFVTVNDFGISLSIQDESDPTTTIFKLELTSDGKLFIQGLPTSNPNQTNRIWNDNGTLKISS
jgi:hypothetical protein